MSRRRQVKPGPVLWVGVAACIGGILAVGVLELVHAFSRWTIVVLVGAAVVVLCMLATSLLPSTSGSEPAEPVRSWASPAGRTGFSPDVHPDGQPWVPGQSAGTSSAAAQPGAEAGGDAASAAGRSPAVAGAPSSQGPASSVGLRVPRVNAWWESTSTQTQAAAERAVSAQPARSDLPDVPVDLSTYSGVARVVQCPRCGDFRVDVRQQDDYFTFTCRLCSHPWRWSPGSPWPPNVVRPSNAEQRPDAGRFAAGSA